MKNIKNILSVLAIFVGFAISNAQSTYTIGNTEYIYGEYYSTTGKPKVVRSAANKSAFLKSKGYNRTPYGYEIDHIVPLSQGGTDDPSNMQLLTVYQHKVKTARERSTRAKTNTYSTYKVNAPNYYSTPTIKQTRLKYSTPNSNPGQSIKSTRTIYTGARGGKYYINSNGNKTYVKR
ncbi:HNH endonuclease signature motif containing protein [Lacinutrix sp. MEBiC02404]